MSANFRIRVFQNRNDQSFVFQIGNEKEDEALRKMSSSHEGAKYQRLRSIRLHEEMDRVLSSLGQGQQLISVELLFKLFCTAIEIGSRAKPRPIRDPSRPLVTTWVATPEARELFDLISKIRPGEDTRWLSDIDGADANELLGVVEGVDCVYWTRKDIIQMVQNGFQVGWVGTK
jgi:hypothetical protein